MIERIALVIPTFNEESGINRTLRATKKISSAVTTVFVDDGSTDQTVRLIKDGLDSTSQALVISETNQGYGYACRIGAEFAASNGFSWVIFADSDLTNPISDVLMVSNLIQDNPHVDILKGDRFKMPGGLKNVEAKRRIMTILARSFSRKCFHNFVSDPTNGFRAVKSELLISLPLSANDFSIIVEELYLLRKKKATAMNFGTFLYTRDDDLRESSFNYSIKQIKSYLY